MIELPRAALRAGEIAESAEFFSFGTNDLTQTALGISRDDAASFLGSYTRRASCRPIPFVTIDQEGVGELIRIAVERGAHPQRHQARHLRRARRRPGLGAFLPRGRPRLRLLLALPRADRAPRLVHGGGEQRPAGRDQRRRAWHGIEARRWGGARSSRRGVEPRRDASRSAGAPGGSGFRGPDETDLMLQDLPPRAQSESGPPPYPEVERTAKSDPVLQLGPSLSRRASGVRHRFAAPGLRVVFSRDERLLRRRSSCGARSRRPTWTRDSSLGTGGTRPRRARPRSSSRPPPRGGLDRRPPWRATTPRRGPRRRALLDDARAGGFDARLDRRGARLPSATIGAAR